MKTITALLIVLTAGVAAYSQSNQPFPARNSRPRVVVADTTRYEIVTLGQTSLTIKIDRYTGKTSQYVYGQRRWFLMSVRGGLPGAAGNSTPKYDLYDEGNFVFLINNETGQSWILNVTNWEPILD